MTDAKKYSNKTLAAFDLETRCNVPSCSHFHKSNCINKHSLNPWRDEITVIGIYDELGHGKVFRGSFAALSALSYVEKNNLALVAHNGKFDLLHLCVNEPRWLELLGSWVGDTNLLAAASTVKIPDEWLDQYNAARGPNDRKGGKHGLKTLAPYHLGIEPFWEKADHDDDTYVLKDCEYTLRLYQKLMRDGGPEIEFVETKLLPWTKMVLQAELRGITLDVEGLEQFKHELESKVVDMESRLNEMWAPAHVAYAQMQRDIVNAKYDGMVQRSNTQANREKALARVETRVNLASPAQVAWLLRDFLGYDITSLEGDQSTGKEVLERLAAQGCDDVKLFLEWRATDKLMTAFIPTYLDLQTKGVIHPSYNMALREREGGGESGTKTGRLSCEMPNIQQAPPAIKSFMRARPGYKFVMHDLSAVEMRAIALFTQDPIYFEIMKTGQSIHDRNVGVFLGIDTPVEDVKKLHPVERSASKNVGFALVFNAGANRIRVAFSQKGIMISESEARAIHKRWKQTYSATMEYARELVEYFESGGTTINLMGRPVGVENPQDCYMRSLNLLVQSSASDLLLEWSLRTAEAARGAGIEAHPLLFVHDMTCFEVRADQAEVFEKLLTDQLKEFTIATEQGDVEFTSEGGISDGWEKE